MIDASLRYRPRPRMRSTSSSIAACLRAALIAHALATVLLGCTDSATTPGSADLPAILSEATEADAASIEGPPARRAVRASVRHLLDADKKCAADVWRRWQRPELYFYLLRAESFIGGTFPSGTAALLREVEQLEDEYLAGLRGFPDLLARRLAGCGVPEDQRQVVVDGMAPAVAARWRPVVAAVEAHRSFVAAAAALYELVASRPESIKAMRDGLKISDAALEALFDDSADAVNDAHDAMKIVVKALDAEQGATFHWLARTQRVQR